MHADELVSRIEHLIRHRLQRIGTDGSGWDTLYRDPRDGRLWEHSYPASHLHGGVPPVLRLIAPMAAAAKYAAFTA